MRIRRSRAADDAGIDLTPMLDIVFIMLIFFIVTATFLRETGVDLNRPPPEQSKPTKTEASVLITITQSGSVYFGDRVIADTAVRANVERFVAENPKGGIIISASPRAKTKVLVEVIDQVRQAGATPVIIPASE